MDKVSMKPLATSSKQAYFKIFLRCALIYPHLSLQLQQVMPKGLLKPSFWNSFLSHLKKIREDANKYKVSCRFRIKSSRYKCIQRLYGKAMQIRSIRMTVFGKLVFLCVIISDTKLQGISMLKLERRYKRRGTSRHMIQNHQVTTKLTLSYAYSPTSIEVPNAFDTTFKSTHF